MRCLSRKVPPFYKMSSRRFLKLNEDNEQCEKHE